MMTVVPSMMMMMMMMWHIWTGGAVRTVHQDRWACLLGLGVCRLSWSRFLWLRSNFGKAWYLSVKESEVRLMLKLVAWPLKASTQRTTVPRFLQQYIDWFQARGIISHEIRWLIWWPIESHPMDVIDDWSWVDGNGKPSTAWLQSNLNHSIDSSWSHFNLLNLYLW